MPGSDLASDPTWTEGKGTSDNIMLWRWVFQLAPDTICVHGPRFTIFTQNWEELLTLGCTSLSTVHSQNPELCPVGMDGQEVHGAASPCSLSLPHISLRHVRLLSLWEGPHSKCLTPPITHQSLHSSCKDTHICQQAAQRGTTGAAVGWSDLEANCNIKLSLQYVCMIFKQCLLFRGKTPKTSLKLTNAYLLTLLKVALNSPFWASRIQTINY